MNTLILGAGFTGLAAGIKTGFPIYEMSDHAGGICTSYYKEGFQFEVGGGHWIFGKGIGLDYIKSLVEVKEYIRRAGVYYNHTFPYPLQTTAQKEMVSKPGSMKSWLADNFSQAECNLFFNPFNEKYTCGLYDDVIQYDAFKTPPAGSLGFVSTFCDPILGLSSLVEKMSEKCTIEYNKRADAINPDKKIIMFQDGNVIKYDKLISTIPLNRILDICGKKDHDLPYTSVLVLNIGAEKGMRTPEEHWLYIPFCKNHFYRIGFYSNVEANKAPAGKVGLSVEMAFRDVDYEDLDIDFITDEVVKELQSWGFIGKTIVVDPTWVKCAYTWLRNKEEVPKQLAWLKERGIYSTGRYGSWKFCGMTESIKMGFEA